MSTTARALRGGAGLGTFVLLFASIYVQGARRETKEGRINIAVPSGKFSGADAPIDVPVSVAQLGEADAEPEPKEADAERPKADAAIPPVPEPKGCPETLTGAGLDYRGCQTKTQSGKTCQKWSEQKPYTHVNTPEKWPDAGLKGNNYCRNPDGEKKIWCYTTGDVRWEYCDPKADAEPEPKAAIPPVEPGPKEDAEPEPKEDAEPEPKGVDAKIVLAKECPLGYEEILDEEECSSAYEAASAWMHPDMMSHFRRDGGGYVAEPFDNLPQGCFIHELRRLIVVFNPMPTGIAFDLHPAGRICKSKKEGATHPRTYAVSPSKCPSGSEDTNPHTYAVSEGECPSGSEEILDETECRSAWEAASAWMHPDLMSHLCREWAGFVADYFDNMPHGCFIRETKRTNVVFNPMRTGIAVRDDPHSLYLICKKKEGRSLS